MSRWTIAAALLCVHAGAFAAPPREYRLYNDVTDRRLTSYHIERTIRRATERAGREETLTFSRSSRWVRLQLLAERRGNSKLVQMIVDEPPQQVAVLRNGRPVEAEPDPLELRLDPGSTRLSTDDWNKTDTPCLVPACEPSQQAAIFALLDVTHWPRGGQQVGDRWDTPIASELFSGTQSVALKDSGRIGDRTYLKLEISVTGRFRGKAARDGADFVGGTATVLWPYGRNVLESLEGTAAWKRGDERYEMKLRATIASNEVLSIDAANDLIDQLNAINAAIVDKNGGKLAEARAACAAYVEKWPNGLWRPAIDYLAADLDPQRNRSIAEAEFRQRVLASLKRWQDAGNRDDEAALDAARAELRILADEERARLLDLMKHESQNVRASTAFTLAFGSSAENLAAIQAAARDPSPRVRGWALYGIAERGSRETDVSVLADALGDEDPVVRARACEAVAACVPPGSPRMPELRERIFDLLLHDHRDGTRLAAAVAMGKIGTRDDLERLRKSIKHETSGKIRQRIERAIGQIQRQEP
jgi:HEAT repeat protein